MTQETLLGVAIVALVLVFGLAVAAQRAKETESVGCVLFHSLVRLALPVLVPVVTFAILFIIIYLGMNS